MIFTPQSPPPLKKGEKPFGTASLFHIEINQQMNLPCREFNVYMYMTVTSNIHALNRNLEAVISTSATASHQHVNTEAGLIQLL